MYLNNNLPLSLIDDIAKIMEKTRHPEPIVEGALIQIPGYGQITREQAKQKAAQHLKSAADHLLNGHHSAAYHHNQMAHAFLGALHNDKETSSIPK